jgi:hypothetical protein
LSLRKNQVTQRRFYKAMEEQRQDIMPLTKEQFKQLNQVLAADGIDTLHLTQPHIIQATQQPASLSSVSHDQNQHSHPLVNNYSPTESWVSVLTHNNTRQVLILLLVDV